MKWLWQSPLNSIISGVLKAVPVGDAEIVNTLQQEGEPSLLAFCDLSPLLRTGIKFETTTTALPSVNQTAVADGGEMLCRLGDDELLLLAAPDGKMNPKDNLPTASVEIPRRDGLCWIGLCGERANDLLARLCAAPPPVSPNLSQTVVADIGAILIPDGRAKTPTYHLLADIGYAEYLWLGISKVAAPLQGAPIGWKNWKSLYKKP